MKTFRLYITLSLLLAFVSTTSASANQDTATTATAELSGIVIDLGSSGDAVFNHDRHGIYQGAVFSRESFTAYYGTSLLIIDILSGDMDRDVYRSSSQADIASTYTHTDWIGGEEFPGGFWDIYSGAYKLDYREIAYLEYGTDTEANLSFGVGIYDSADNLPNALVWMQDNVTIDGTSVFERADVQIIGDIIAGHGDYQAEPVERPISSLKDWADAGLISETEWQSPFSSAAFNWDGDAWRFLFDQPDALIADNGFTNLTLHTEDRTGEVQLMTADEGTTPDEYLEMITSDEQLERMSDTEVIATAKSDSTASAIMVQHTMLGDPIVIIADAWVNDDGILIVTNIYSTPEDISTVYESFWNNVQSNGEYYPLTWTLEEIESLQLD